MQIIKGSGKGQQPNPISITSAHVASSHMTRYFSISSEQIPIRAFDIN